MAKKARSRSTGLSVAFKGQDEFIQRVDFLMRNTRDLSYAWREFYDPAIVEANRMFWQTEGEGKWKDLSEEYFWQKVRAGVGGRVMYGTPPRKKYPRPNPGGLMRSFTGANPSTRAEKFFPREMWHVYSDPLSNIFFTAKGKRARKPLNVRSVAMRLQLNEAVREHGLWYDRMWGGRSRMVA